jgi:ureidoglycolate lyase
MELIPQPLTKEAFAPFGDVIDVPDVAGRTYYEDALGNLRPTAHASLSVSLKAETPDRPLRSDYMERHELKAFIATGKQGVTYRPDTWHHGLTVLDRPGRFAVFMWRDGGKGDEEFVPVTPFTIPIP